MIGLNKAYDLEVISADATQLSRWFESKILSPQEYLEQLIAVTEKINPLINAYISFGPANWIENRSDSLKDGMLEGIPIAIKDNIDVANFQTTAGMATRRAVLANQDAFVVKKLKKAGAIITGKLNMHEAALGATNNNPHFGACQNPYRFGFTPGGSSGGSAAAVAGLMVPLSLGTDTMGSVRIPASYCGVCGFKPSYGAVSTAQSVSVSHRLDHIGPIARSVNDLILVFNAIKGFDSSHLYSRDIQVDKNRKDNYRIGIIENLTDYGVQTEIVDIYIQQLKYLEKLGHHLVAVDFGDYDFAKMRRAGLLVSEFEMLQVHHQDWENQKFNFSAELTQLLSWAESKSLDDIKIANQKIDAAAKKAHSVFNTIDMLCLPTTLQTAFSFEQPTPANQADLTSFANFSGNPALSVPTNQWIDGLPTGIQFIGRYQSDLAVLQLGLDYHRQIDYVFTPPKPIWELLQ